MGIRINIYKDKENYYADVEADGHMMSIRVRALVIGTNDKIELLYKEVINESKEYQINEILLRMEKTYNEIYTEWGAVKPISSHYAKKGIFLQKRD